VDIDGAIILGERRKRRIVPVVAFLVPMIVVVAGAAWFVRAFVAPPTVDIPAPSLMSAEAASAAASLAASRHPETLGARPADPAAPTGPSLAARPASASTTDDLPTLSSWISSPSGRSGRQPSWAVPMVATLSYVPPAASLPSPDAAAPPAQARTPAQASAATQVAAPTPDPTPSRAAQPAAPPPPVQAAAPAAAPAPRQAVASNDPFAAIVDDWNKPAAVPVPLPPERPRVTAVVQGPVPLPRPRPRVEPVPETRPPDNPFSFLFR
jgi:hypothetical protein